MLSVVIATWNSEPTIERCLVSLQPHLEMIQEVLLVDNCSIDETLKIAERLIPSDKLKVLREADSGIYDALNKGIEAAAGNAIYFLGSDDFVLPGFGEVLRDARLGKHILVGVVTHGGQRLAFSHRFSGLRLLFRNIPHQGMFIPTEYLRASPYDSRYPVLADYAWNLSHFWQVSKKYVFLSSVCAEWSPGGVSGRRVDAAFLGDKEKLIKQNSSHFVGHLFSAFKVVQRKKTQLTRMKRR